jgi:hypothetical protein
MQSAIILSNNAKCLYADCRGAQIVDKNANVFMWQTL